MTPSIRRIACNSSYRSLLDYLSWSVHSPTLPVPLPHPHPDNIGPISGRPGGLRAVLGSHQARPEISDSIGPARPSPIGPHDSNLKPDRFKNRAGRAGPKTGRARAGFGLFGPERPSLMTMIWMRLKSIWKSVVLNSVRFLCCYCK